jgi:hypothetical protein
MEYSKTQTEVIEMVLRDYGSLMILIIVGIIALSGVISSYINGPDKEYEQAVEAIIKSQTGVDVDLSPSG